LDEIKAELSARLPSGVAFEIPLFGGIPVPQSTVMTWIIIGVITVLCIWLTHNLKERPGRRQMVAEVLGETCSLALILGGVYLILTGTISALIPFSYLGTVAVYLVVSNTCGLFGFTPPTKDLNVAAALAIMSGVLIYAAQFKYHGFRGGMKKFASPSVMIAPLNVMEIGIRPLSLCFRLFGNILGAYIIMELIKIVCPLVLPIPFSLYFDIFDGILQAVVFVFLTTLFLSESLED